MAKRRAPKPGRGSKKRRPAVRSEDEREQSALARERKESEKIQSIAIWIVVIGFVLLIGAIVYNEATKEPNIPLPADGNLASNDSSGDSNRTNRTISNDTRPPIDTTPDSNDTTSTDTSSTDEPKEPIGLPGDDDDDDDEQAGDMGEDFKGPTDKYGEYANDPRGYYPIGYKWIPLEERNVLEKKLRDVMEFKMSGNDLEMLKREMTRVGYKVVPVALDAFRKVDFKDSDKVMQAKELTSILSRITRRGSNVSDDLWFDPMNQNRKTQEFILRQWLRYWKDEAPKHKEAISKAKE